MIIYASTKACVRSHVVVAHGLTRVTIDCEELIDLVPEQVLINERACIELGHGLACWAAELWRLGPVVHV